MEGLRTWHADEAAAEVADQADTPGPRRPDLVIPLDWNRVKMENRDFMKALGHQAQSSQHLPFAGKWTTADSAYALRSPSLGRGWTLGPARYSTG